MSRDYGDYNDYDEYYYEASLRFKQVYRCCPMSVLNKEELEKGDKVIMPPSALDRLGRLDIDYPMLFQLTNPHSGKVTHCGVLEFTADEGIVYLPSWMMEGLQIEEGRVVVVENASLPKGTYVKLQPHTKNFLDVSNPRAVLERTLRNYSCLTTGDTIVINYNSNKFLIDIVETKPSRAICIIETDCEADFAPPLDYVEPEKPAKSTKQEVAEESERETKKCSSFTGSSRRLDGQPSTTQVSLPKRESDGCKESPAESRKLVFGSNATNGKLVFGSHASNGNQKSPSNGGTQDPTTKEKKFEAFSGRKYMLTD